MRHFIIGDVHGMSEELDALVRALEPRFDDHFVFVGDLVDKGPESPAVVRSVRELSQKFEVVLVEGNHEEKHRRFRSHLAAGRGTENAMTGVDEMRRITAELSEEDVAFLDAAPPFHHIHEHGVLIVHAGIPGTMRQFPKTPDVIAKMNSRQAKGFKLIMRTRFLDAEDGRFLSMGKEEATDPFWAEVYDGRFGHVVFGHEPFLEGPRVFRHATGVDTGAVFGGSLTALVLETGSKEHRFVSVPSRGRFSEPYGT